MNKKLPWEFEIKSLKASGSIFCRVSKKNVEKITFKDFYLDFGWKRDKMCPTFQIFFLFPKGEHISSHKSHSKSLWSQTASTNGEPCLIPYLPDAPNKSLWWTGNSPNDPKKTQKRKSSIQGVFLDQTWKVHFLVGNHLNWRLTSQSLRPDIPGLVPDYITTPRFTFRVFYKTWSVL